MIEKSDLIKVQFLPIKTGYLQLPQLMLVQIKEDGSEHQHLLNDIDLNNKFFVKENYIKTAKLLI